MKPSREKKKPWFNKGKVVKQFYQWHSISSAIVLFSMLLFAFTGLTLNHSKQIKVQPKKIERTFDIPPLLLTTLAHLEVREGLAPFPRPIAQELSQITGLRLHSKPVEWGEDEFYIPLDKPGQSAGLVIDRESGEIIYNETKRGVLALMNDLHQGKHTGGAWLLYMDIFSISCLIFTLTGVGILWSHAKRRPRTYPLILSGLLVPLILIFLTLH